MPRNPFDDSLPPLSTDTSEYGEFDPYQRKPLSRLTSPIALDTPPQYRQDKRGDMLGAFFATLGGLLGGNKDMAGQFGASFLQGRQAGRERNYQRDVQQWQNKRSNDIYANQQDVARTQQNNAITQQENNAARQFWADNRAMAGDERQLRLDALTAEQRAAMARDNVFATLQKLPTDEARQTYLSSLHLTGRLSALGLDSTFQPTADGRFTLPDFNKPVDNTAMLGRLVSNPLLTPQGREQVGGLLMSRLGGRMPQGLLTQGMITNPAPQSPPTPAETVPTGPAPSLVPYLNRPETVPMQAQIVPQQAPKPSPLFYPSGMTPRDEGNIAARRESLRQGAARVDVAQKGLRAREAQVKQQGEIAKTRIAQQSEQFKQRMDAQKERDRLKSADKTREEGKKEYQRIDGTVQKLRQELVKLRTATTLRPGKDDLSSEANRKDFEKRALEAEIKRGLRKQELERLIAGYRAQQTDIAKRYGFRLSAAPQTQVGDGWMPNNRIVDFGKGK